MLRPPGPLARRERRACRVVCKERATLWADRRIGDGPCKTSHVERDEHLGGPENRACVRFSGLFFRSMEVFATDRDCAHQKVGRASDEFRDRHHNSFMPAAAFVRSAPGWWGGEWGWEPVDRAHEASPGGLPSPTGPCKRNPQWNGRLQ